MSDPGPARPDTSDWTWVLSRPCLQCGFDAKTVTPDRMPRILAEAAVGFTAALDRADVRERPEPGVWSPLEYDCHVRDVCRVMTGRLEQILTGGGAAVQFASWDQNAASVEEHYWRSNPDVVRAEVADAFLTAGDAFARPTAAQWEWQGERGDGTVFTALTLAQYFAHELHHHLWDIQG